MSLKLFFWSDVQPTKKVDIMSKGSKRKSMGYPEMVENGNKDFKVLSYVANVDGFGFLLNVLKVP
jgi:hypothetical protein